MSTPEAKAEALRLLSEIRAAFGFEPLDDPETSALLPLLETGALLFDPKKETLEYRLSSPLELKDGSRQEYVTFREAAASELEYIRGGASLSGSKGMTLGEFIGMTVRVLVKTSDISTIVASRIKARDVDALKEVMTELGFFGR